MEAGEEVDGVPVGPPFPGRGLLVGANQGGIEHEVLVIRVAGQALETPLPDFLPSG